MVQVTAISLGHPRLAVINGHQVAEGDSFALHITPASVVVRLRVLKIVDGRIDLTDGQQVLSVRLAAPTPKTPLPSTACLSARDGIVVAFK